MGGQMSADTKGPVEKGLDAVDSAVSKITHPRRSLREAAQAIDGAFADKPVVPEAPTPNLNLERGNTYTVKNGGTFEQVAAKTGFPDPKDGAEFLKAINPELTGRRQDGKLKPGDKVFTSLKIEAVVPDKIALGAEPDPD